MAKEQHEDQGDDAKGAPHVGEERNTARLDLSKDEQDGRQQRRGESQRHQEPPKVGCPHPFPEVLHHASVSRRWFCSLYLDGHFISISVARKCSPDALPYRSMLSERSRPVGLAFSSQTSRS